VTAAPLLALWLLATPAGAPGGPIHAPAAERLRTEILLRFPPWQFTGRFTLTAGPLSDEGVVRDRGALVGVEAVERTLEGQRGTLTLRLDDLQRSGGYPPYVGRWRVTAGTGAYAGLAGGGTFTAVDGGSERGSPFEVQAMLGQLSRR
jgi:hypothetical protein